MEIFLSSCAGDTLAVTVRSPELGSRSLHSRELQWPHGCPAWLPTHPTLKHSDKVVHSRNSVVWMLKIPWVPEPLAEPQFPVPFVLQRVDTSMDSGLGLSTPRAQPAAPTATAHRDTSTERISQILNIGNRLPDKWCNLPHWKYSRLSLTGLLISPAFNRKLDHMIFRAVFPPRLFSLFHTAKILNFMMHDSSFKKLLQESCHTP